MDLNMFQGNRMTAGGHRDRKHVIYFKTSFYLVKTERYVNAVCVNVSTQYCRFG